MAEIVDLYERYEFAVQAVARRIARDELGRQLGMISLIKGRFTPAGADRDQFVSDVQKEVARLDGPQPDIAETISRWRETMVAASPRRARAEERDEALRSTIAELKQLTPAEQRAAIYAMRTNAEMMAEAPWMFADAIDYGAHFAAAVEAALETEPGGFPS